MSGKEGHESEFIKCSLTKQYLTSDEAEKCDETGELVLPQQLVICEISKRHVLPTLVRSSDVSGRRALRQHVLASSISELTLLADEVVRSRAGDVCGFDEAIVCNWSGQLCHPDDIRVCQLAGLSFQRGFVSEDPNLQHELLIAHLNGSKANADRTDLWATVEKNLVARVGGKVTIESAQLSPHADLIVFSAQVKKYLGFQTQHAGGFYSIVENQIIGRSAVGRRRGGIWSKR